MVYDCVASSYSIHQALRLAGPRGRVVLVGMPGIPKGVDWSSIWYRELKVRGVYTYGSETITGTRRRTFEVAIEKMEEWRDRLEPLVTHRFPLDDYRKAVGMAMTAGRNGALKVAFEMGTPEKGTVTL